MSSERAMDFDTTLPQGPEIAQRPRVRRDSRVPRISWDVSDEVSTVVPTPSSSPTSGNVCQVVALKDVLENIAGSYWAERGWVCI